MTVHDHEDSLPDRSKPTDLPDLGSHANRGHSYGQILKSSALIGGSSALNILVGVLRTKAMALLLGPAGIGLMGLYSAILHLVVTVAGLGINSSGVRQIAQAVATNDAQQIARTVTVLRRTSVVLGLVGAALLVVFAANFSIQTFGSYEYQGAIAILSGAVFCQLVSASQGALLQGMRRISDLALSGVLGTVLGSVASVLLVYFFREDGIAPSIVAGAGIGLLLSWWYSRRAKIPPVRMPLSTIGKEGSELLALGLVFMVSALVQVGGAYVVRALVVRTLGIEAAGLYQAAWALGGLYVGVILQAMGADFYPRLVGVVTDNTQSNRLVNEQTHVSLLLGGPGVIATITLASVVLSVFYTAEFAAAADLLRWFCLGIALRVITWPLGFIIVAKGRKGIILITELAWCAVYLGLSWFCMREFGLTGAGVAFFGSYVFHGLIVYPIVRRLSDFRWEKGNLRSGLFFLTSIVIVFAGFVVLPRLPAILLGILVLSISAIHSIHDLVNVTAPQSLPSIVRRVISRVHRFGT